LIPIIDKEKHVIGVVSQVCIAQTMFQSPATFANRVKEVKSSFLATLQKQEKSLKDIFSFSGLF
jgi:predicted transcriptional regulator